MSNCQEKCIQRYCEFWIISNPEPDVSTFLKKMCKLFLAYQCQINVNTIDLNAEICLSDKELATLFHFFSIHGQCKQQCIR